MPKNIQRILIKLLKTLNLWSEENIDWYAPVEIPIDELDTILYINYSEGYLIFTSHLAYTKQINKNWDILNTLNNPIYQPSILVYTSEPENNIIIWSKEPASGLNYNDINEWLKLFFNVLFKIKEDVIDVIASTSDTSNSYSFLAKMIK